MRSYQEYKIPTAWMLDSGMVTKVSLLCFYHVLLSKTCFWSAIRSFIWIAFTIVEISVFGFLFASTQTRKRIPKHTWKKDFATLTSTWTDIEFNGNQNIRSSLINIVLNFLTCNVWAIVAHNFLAFSRAPPPYIALLFWSWFVTQWKWNST